MAELAALVRHLNRILEISSYADSSQNGLQVKSANTKIGRVAVSVDAGLSVLEAAVAKKADLLIVHHGLFWGENESLTPILRRKIALLNRAGCSLYAAHLPLDGHLKLGNAAQLAIWLGLERWRGFCKHNRRTIGVSADLARPKSIKHFATKLKQLPGARKPLVLPFGVPEIRRLGIVTGSGSTALDLCPRAGIELLITGEPKQSAYHQAKELGVNVIFAGHYATETLGVRALARALEKDYKVSTLFIHEPTGI